MIVQLYAIRWRARPSPSVASKQLTVSTPPKRGEAPKRLRGLAEQLIGEGAERAEEKEEE